jgi:hypothetical protein
MITAYNSLYRFIELAAMASGKMIRNHFEQADQPELICSWFNQFKDADWFTSVFRYTQASRQSPWIAPIFFDIDSAKNLEQARSDTLTLCLWLKDWFRIPIEYLDIYFSGGKGMHVLISTRVFAPKDSAYMLKACQFIASQAVAAGVGHLDTGVYTHGRLLRLPNSKHSRTNFWKIPLTFEELRDLGMEGILELARNPRPQNSYAEPAFCKEAAQRYEQIVIDCEKTAAVKPTPGVRINTGFKYGWRVPPCIKAIEEATITDGMRHDLYTTLCRYYGYLNMHPEEMLERIQKIDSRNPIRDPDSIERAIKWGCSHPGFPGCDNANLQKYCRKETCFYAKLKKQKINNT